MGLLNKKPKSQPTLGEFREKDGCLYVVHSEPNGQEVWIPTLKSNIGVTMVNIEINGEMVQVDSVLLRQFHGDPCEEKTRSIGGKGRYERR